jgi:hypothetical protein
MTRNLNYGRFWRLRPVRIFIILTVWTEKKRFSHFEDGESKFFTKFRKKQTTLHGVTTQKLAII